MVGTELRRLLRRFFSFFVDHWIIAGLIPPLPGLVSLGLKAFSVEPTPEVEKACIGVIGVAVLFSLAKSKAVKYEIGIRGNTDFVLARLLEATNAITKMKLERFAEFLRARTCPLPAHPFDGRPFCT